MKDNTDSYSYLRNCHLIQRFDDWNLFKATTDAQGREVMAARLDGYAIIPKEHYESLLRASRDGSLVIWHPTAKVS